MKTYKNIYFTVSKPIEVILDSITDSLKDGWTRDEKSDSDFRQLAGPDAASHYFHCDKREERWAATLILTRTEPDKYWLSHVLPIEDSPNPFPHEDFNSIADEFLNKFLIPL